MNRDSLNACLSAAESGPNTVRPLHASFCFSNLPSTIASIFDHVNTGTVPPSCLPVRAGEVDRVVSLFVDALGFRFIEQLDHPFLTRCEKDGIVSKLTAQFPSTTAAAVTTYATGLPVGLSGVYEWWQYHPALNDLIRPLLFTARGKNEIGSLVNRGVTPSDIFPADQTSERLGAAGASVTWVGPKRILSSTTSNYLLRGLTRIGFDAEEELPELAQELRDIERGVIHVYIESFDHACHHHGPDSETSRGVRNAVLDTIERMVSALGNGRTLFLVFSDHGQTAVRARDRQWAIHLNEEVPELILWLKKSTQGDLLPPAGGARDAFLHVEDSYLLDAKIAISTILQDRAQVILTEDLIKNGFFGPVGDRLRSVIGNLAILPEPGRTVHWKGHAKNRFDYLGDHGGLSADEMEIPLLALVQ